MDHPSFLLTPRCRRHIFKLLEKQEAKDSNKKVLQYSKTLPSKGEKRTLSHLEHGRGWLQQEEAAASDLGVAVIWWLLSSPAERGNSKLVTK